MKEKFHLYEQSGVKEYWMVYPEQKTVVVFLLDDKGKYGRPNIYSETESIKPKVLNEVMNEVMIDLKALFEE